KVTQSSGSRSGSGLGGGDIGGGRVVRAQNAHRITLGGAADLPNRRAHFRKKQKNFYFFLPPTKKSPLTIHSRITLNVSTTTLLAPAAYSDTDGETSLRSRRRRRRAVMGG